jgi:DNA-binding response OmpR family regulator
VGRRGTDKIQNPDRHFDRRNNGVINRGPFTLDDRTKKVYVDGEEKSLTPRLFDLLRIFVTNPGKVLSLAELAANLSSLNDNLEPHDVKQYIYLLRRAIEPDPTRPRWLRNVRGFGYELVAK